MTSTDALIARLPTASAPYWTSIGPVRGWCGHRHRSEAAAARCLKEDQAGCRSQGGYSDRVVVRKDAPSR